MNRRATGVLAAGVAVLVSFAGIALWLDRAKPPPPVEVSAGPIYAAVFKDVAGKEQALGQWQRKLLVINFWATWCAPCREEMPLLDRAQKENAAKNMQIIGIAADSTANVAAFHNQVRVDYPLLIGDSAALEFSRRLGNRLGLLPFTIAVAPGGDVVFTRMGPVTAEDLSALSAKFAQK